MKQTAIEWLVENLDIIWEEKIIDLVEQAKKIEKEQIIDAYNTSFLLRDKPYETANKYYNETYETKKD
jgi:hypothetical protein